MIDWETCDLCELVGPNTAINVFLVKWKDVSKHGGKPYGTIARCRDAQACRDRYERPDRRWPIEDRTVPTLPAKVKVVTPQRDLGPGAEAAR